MKTRVIALALAASLMTPKLVIAGSSFLLTDGINRAPAVVLHCVLASGLAVACGVAANPLIVTSGPGASSASNQLQQLSAEQSSSQAMGSIADAAFNGGQGSMIALLKGLWSATAAGVPALPTGGLLTSKTVSLPGAVSTQLFAANATRRYLSFQVPQGSAIWVNVMGGPAGPSLADCAYFAPGSFYESGQFVNRGAITVYAAVAVMLSAWEN